MRGEQYSFLKAPSHNRSGPSQNSASASDFYSYEEAADVNHRRRYGQVFTPAAVGAVMADWIAACHPRTILDPAIGSGVLAEACLARIPGSRIDGFDIDSLILSFLPERVRAAGEIRNADFLTADIQRSYDAVIMNPPYVRHRELRDHDERRRSVALASDCAIPKSANLYVDFVLKASLAIAEGGRGAFLIPSEWMSANFSSSLKRYLVNSGLLHSIITFSHCSQIFDGVLTTASLLLLERGRRPTQVTSYYLDGLNAAQIPTTMMGVAQIASTRMVNVQSLYEAPKWEPVLRGNGFVMPDGWTTLDMLATPRRGIATGANQFFLVSRGVADRHGLRPANLTPCIGRARDVAGLVFRPDDLARLDIEGANVWLLDFKSPPDNREREYIVSGEAAGFAERFLTRTRKPWFSMEQRETSSIWAGVFARGDLRFIYNDAGTKSLTNFHCLYPRREGKIFARALVAALNSSRVREAMLDHRRGFGGGLSKFEPNDLKTIPVPDLRHAGADMIEALSAALDLGDQDVRQRSTHRQPALDQIVALL